MPSKKPLFQNYLKHCLNHRIHDRQLWWDNQDQGTFYVSMKRRNSRGWVSEDSAHYVGWDKVNFDSGIQDRKPKLNDSDYLNNSRHRFKAAFTRIEMEKEINFLEKGNEIWLCQFLPTDYASNPTSPIFQEDTTSEEDTETLISDLLDVEEEDEMFSQSSVNVADSFNEVSLENIEVTFICKILLDSEKVYDIYLASNDTFLVFENGNVYCSASKLENIFELLLQSFFVNMTSNLMALACTVWLHSDTGKRVIEIFLDSNSCTWIREDNIMVQIVNLDSDLFANLINGVQLADLATHLLEE